MEKYHSKVLDLDYAKNPKTGNVHFNELSKLTGKQIIYTPEEMKILNETGGEVTKTIHNTKSIFGGNITRDKGKRNFKDKYEVPVW